MVPRIERAKPQRAKVVKHDLALWRRFSKLLIGISILALMAQAERARVPRATPIHIYIGVAFSVLALSMALWEPFERAIE